MAYQATIDYEKLYRKSLVEIEKLKLQLEEPEFKWTDALSCEFVGFYQQKAKQGEHEMQAILNQFKQHIKNR